MHKEDVAFYWGMFVGVAAALLGVLLAMILLGVF